MSRPCPTRFHSLSHSIPFARRLKVEQLEDRRMLSVLFVDADAAAGGDGSAWGSAYRDLQDALSEAETLNSDADAGNDVDQIWIAEGVYRPRKTLTHVGLNNATFALVDGTTLYGGFDGSEAALDDRNWSAHETILSGDLGVAGSTRDNAFTVVYCREGVRAGIDGVSVVDGYADSSLSSNYYEQSCGGGVFNNGGTLTIANCTIANNTANSYGGGIFNYSGTLTIFASTIRANRVWNFGGGVYHYDGAATVANSVIVGNKAEYGGGAICHGDGSLTIDNSTISGNFTDLYGGGVYSGAERLTLVNSIVAFNEADDVMGTLSGESTNNLISLDPKFMRNPGAYGEDDYGDLRLTSESAAVDAGDTARIPPDLCDFNRNGDLTEPFPLDIGGNPRLFGDAVDMGAYEFQAAPAAGRETASATVTTASDSFDLYDDEISLREAIYYVETGSAAGPVVFVPELSGSTIVLNEASLRFDGGVTVDASALPGGLTIDGDGRNRGFAVGAAVDQPVELIGLTVTNGCNARGAAIYNSGTLTVNGCVLSHNLASGKPNYSNAHGFGGGIYNAAGILTVVDSVISGNEAASTTACPARSSGGGIYSTEGTVIVVNSTISGNRAPVRGSGGGICNSEGSLTVTGCTLAGNSAKEGGAVFSSGELTLTESTVAENSVETDGGGIKLDGATMRVTDCVLMRNSAPLNGGGIQIVNLGTAYIRNSTISENRTEESNGGGISVSSGMMTAVNCTISANRAAKGGGGIYSGAELYLTNCTVVANTAGHRGGGIYVPGNLSESEFHNCIVAENHSLYYPDNQDIYHKSAFLYASHCLVGNGWGYARVANGRSGNLAGTASSPLDPCLSDWTRFANGRWGYYPLEGSPVIDAGDGAMAVDATGLPLPADIAGNTRIEAGNVDIGAVEGPCEATPGQVYTVTSLDGPIAEDGELSFMEALQAACGNLPAGDAPAGSFTEQDVIEFAEGVEGTVLLEDGQLVIGGQLRIEGPGPDRLTFDAQGLDRVFFIRQDACVRLSGITVRNGNASGGAGIYSAGSLEIADSVISRNTSESGGGGILSYGFANLTVADSTFYENVAAGSGGAVCMYYGNLTMANSTLAANQAGGAGGAVFNSDATVTLTNSTCARNWAEDGTGGVRDSGDSSVTVLNNTIVAGNLGSPYPDIDCSEGVLSGSHNLIGDGGRYSGLTDGEDGNQVGISESPIDPLLSDLVQFDNGHWGYCLLAGSPALDAGENAATLYSTGEPIFDDLRGGSRLVGNRVDIGAVEGITEATPGRVYTVTSLDGTIAEDGVLSFREAFEAAESNRRVGDAPAGSSTDRDVIQFAAGATGTIVVDEGALAISGTLSIRGPGAERLAFDAKGRNRVFLVRPDASFHLAGVTVTGGAAYQGAAIYTLADLSVAGCRVNGNVAESQGGGIYVNPTGVLTATNSTFAGNRSEEEGAAICSDGAVLILVNSTVSGNWCGAQGAVYLNGGEALLYNTISAENRCSGIRPDLYNRLGSLSGSHNLIGNGYAQHDLTNGQDGNLVGTPEKPIDPRFVRGPSDGGDGWGDKPYTPDIDESLNDDYGDLRLRSDSPAVDAGDNALLPADAYDLDGDGDMDEPIPIDLAGNTRVRDGDGDELATVDMGAYEYFDLLFVPGDLNGDEVVNSGDLNIVRANWGRTVDAGSLVDGDASGDGAVDSGDLNVIRANWGLRAPVAAGAAVRESGLRTKTLPQTDVYGPIPKFEAFQTRERDAVFANAREIAEVFWAEALERSQSRENRREAVAVDWVLSGWEGEG